MPCQVDLFTTSAMIQVLISLTEVEKIDLLIGKVNDIHNLIHILSTKLEN